MIRQEIFVGRKIGMRVPIAALCLAADAKSFVSKPAAYARNYEVYISPTEVLFFMQDSR